eukprot:scaffold23996_cov30-Phaeocystis_antarctica.AAC.2
MPAGVCSACARACAVHVQCNPIHKPHPYPTPSPNPTPTPHQVAQFSGVTDMAEACNLILAACMRVTDAGGGTLPSYHP